MGRCISTVLTVSIQISSYNQSLVSFFTSWPQLSQEITLTLEISACSQLPVARSGPSNAFQKRIPNLCCSFSGSNDLHFHSLEIIFNHSWVLPHVFTCFQPLSTVIESYTHSQPLPLVFGPFHLYQLTPNRPSLFWTFLDTYTHFQVLLEPLHAFPTSSARFQALLASTAHFHLYQLVPNRPSPVLDFFGYLHPFPSSTIHF